MRNMDRNMDREVTDQHLLAPSLTKSSCTKISVGAGNSLQIGARILTEAPRRLKCKAMNDGEITRSTITKAKLHREEFRSNSAT